MNKKRICKTFLILLFLFVIGGLLPGSQAQAASQKTKALKAYKKLLTQKNIQWNSNGVIVKSANCKFALAYIDNNSVPELVLFGGSGLNHGTGFYSVYTYQGGKVKRVANIRDGIVFYKKKGIFVSYTQLHGEYESYLKLSKAKTKMKLRTETYYDTVYYEGETEKKISKSMFEKKLKRLVGSTKVSVPKFYNNTKADRKKYLK